MSLQDTVKTTGGKIKVLIIDDSALIRSIMKQIINSHADMEVVGQAPDPITARDMIKQLNPDVLTLDVEMPRMNGLEFLEKLMRLRPMPVVMVSSLTEKSNEVTLKALELGAVDFVTKPRIGVIDGMNEQIVEIGEKIRSAARARVHRHALGSEKVATPRPLAGTYLNTTEKLVFVGSSTGGTEALKELLSRMPASAPGMLITQHMPETFTNSFAQRLNGLSAMTVKEAENNERILPGHAYIAFAGEEEWCLLLHRIEQGRPGQPAPALGRCAVPQRRRGGRPECARRDPDRHGQGWRAGHVGDAPGQGLHDCAG
jgi:two-component system chemotaxis response regulator CheB